MLLGFELLTGDASVAAVDDGDEVTWLVENECEVNGLDDDAGTLAADVGKSDDELLTSVLRWFALKTPPPFVGLKKKGEATHGCMNKFPRDLLKRLSGLRSIVRYRHRRMIMIRNNRKGQRFVQFNPFPLLYVS